MIIPEGILRPYPVAGEDRPDDRRLGSLVHFELGEATPLAVIIGFPVDEGVRRNGGRPGAAAAPSAIRRELYRMTPDARRFEQFVRVVRRTVDLGDVATTDNLADNQERLGLVVASILEAGAIPIVLGGGHETSFGHFLGYCAVGRPVAILNLDAHADVRTLTAEGGHSGSPFRQAIEHDSGICREYVVAGLQPNRNARAHVEYVTKQGGRVHWIEDLRSGRSLDTLFLPDHDECSLMLSMDMDVVDASYAPGVSAPSTNGMHPRMLARLAYTAGATPSVTSFDLVEVNPSFDLDARTVGLAAHLVWSFISGLVDRFISDTHVQS